jgi:IS605 OrfB family transposase
MAKRKRDKNAVVKTLKLELVDVLNYEPPPKKDGEEYTEKEKKRMFRKELRNLQKRIAQTSNYIMREYFLWELKRIEASKNGIILNEKEELGTTLQNKGYRIATETLKGLNTRNISALTSWLWENWRKYKKKVFNGSMSLPSYGLKQPIHIIKENYKIMPYKNNNEYIVEITFLSPSEGRNRTLKFVTVRQDKYRQNIINKILSGEYRQGSAQLILENNPNKNLSAQKIFFHFNYEFVPQVKEELSDKILGLDLGLKNVVVMQVYDPQQGKFEDLDENECMIDGTELVIYKNKIEALRKKANKATKWKGQGNTGHGRKKRTKNALNIGHKIKNSKSTYNYKLAKYIIDFALKYQCKYIKMEKLTRHGFSDTLLQNWAFNDLQNKIKNKAKENGIEVLFVEPQYTSQQCSKCGYIDKENRETRDNFKCKKCGFEIDADINAARNIALSEKIIKEDDDDE